jgi:hypothetical protein
MVPVQATADVATATTITIAEIRRVDDIEPHRHPAFFQLPRPGAGRTRRITAFLSRTECG